MKMQEVIVRLRQLAPEAADNVDLAIKDFYVLKDLLSDLQACVSSSTREAVLKLIDERSQGLAGFLNIAQDATSKLQELNLSYREKLGPRGPKKPKDAPGQQMLPGIGGDGGTPTAIGETTMSDTSTQGVHDPSARVRQ